MCGQHRAAEYGDSVPLSRLRQSCDSADADDTDGFHAAKLSTGRFFVKRLLPRIHSLSESVRAGSEPLFELDAAQF